MLPVEDFIMKDILEKVEGFTSGRLHKPGEWLERDFETGRFMKKRG